MQLSALIFLTLHTSKAQNIDHDLGLGVIVNVCFACISWYI